MPLNKLENFIKNTEGRILYVNPNDLDSTDAIDNQGNSLTKPFKTIQRALIESARFSYVAGDDNDLVERTTILLFPGEHILDNRPGFGIRSDSGVAKAISPSGAISGALNTFTLTLNSNFDLTQEDNILYKFNSVNGGVVVPRGTSIVGLDLRKTKIRPLYVPNPTDLNVGQSALFRITGACYFWQFTFFDGDDKGLVYTDPVDFSSNNKSKPTFSHHKLTCFEYADGITKLEQFSDLTDLDIYYSKLSNAYNEAAARRSITQKYPSAPKGFSPQRPEFEIVGAFATDPLNISNIESGDGATPGQVVTVTTNIEHNLTGGTPIKIRGINVSDYNISTKVSNVIDSTRFQYSLPFVRPNLPAGSAGGLSSSNGQVLVETDTVTGASPYIFNTSMRSVFGMQGMHADGKKATGFRSMVVAQFTAVSLQKDDRAFVKYDSTNRRYSGIAFSKQTGSLLSSESSSTNPETVYHLDQEANYRKGWRTSHIKVSNDAVVQIVSVFAIGFDKHFNMINGADASITNSNSNFGTFSLAAEGFKKEAFAKDDKGFITSVINPRSIVTSDQKIEYLQLFKDTASSSSKLYLFGQETETVPPSHIAQGFRIGAKVGEKIFVDKAGVSYEATVVMSNGSAATTDTSEKNYEAVHSAATAQVKSVFTIGEGHELQNGESIRIVADNGDLPENLDPHTVYFAITGTGVGGNDNELSNLQIRIASSKTNADLADPIFISTVANTTDKFRIISRVSDKKPNDAGHPIQFDTSRGRWFIHTLPTGNTLHPKINDGTIVSDDISYILRRDDDRSLDEKIYKLRYVVPKELTNGRDPVDGFVLQDSNFTTVLANTDFTKTSIDSSDYAFDRNTRFISQASFDSSLNLVTIRSDKPHNLGVGDQIVVKNVLSTTNSTGLEDKAYNGTFIVDSIVNDKEFKYSNTDVEGVTHTVGTFTNNTQTRTALLPRFSRNDNKDNFFVYRTEVVTPYIDGVQDGIYHLFVLNSDNAMTETSGEFDDSKYNQNIVNLYPEYDRDNVDANPPEATSFAKRFPLGDVVTNDLKKSITRETTNKFLKSFDATVGIVSVTNNTNNSVIDLEEEHGLQALKFHSGITGGSGHTNGTYYNIKLFNSNAAPSVAVWNGATADVTVSGGSVTAATVKEGGSGYIAGTYYFDSSPVAEGGIGGGPDGRVTVSSAGISSATGNYIQVTGISTGTDSYHRISAINTKKQIVVIKSATDKLLDGQQIIDLGPWNAVGSQVFDANVGITTINTTAAHGLVVGNKFRVLDNNDATLGDFIVAGVGNTNQFSAKTTSTLTNPKYVLKHGLSDNEALSSKAGENLGIRGLSIFDHETLILNEAINSSKAAFKVTLPDSTVDATSITSRFPLGSYIEIEGEFMRIASNSLSGSGDEISVIRGALGTISNSHPDGSKIKKIKPIPIELRRPSILRASGHTFEYVGYGPGNYSTALPQLQNRSLSEREEFLTQSQETSCGNVVYTGMNDKGDFYIGNTKIASASGQQTTFDIPIPTVTGEDPNRLSIVADEVVVKERLLVEGGTSKQILSQFDGPVTFNENVRLANPNKKLDVTGNVNIADTGQLNVNSTVNSTSTITGAAVIDGGLGLGKDLVIGGNILPSVDDNSDIGSPTLRFQDIYGVNFHGDGANLTNTGAQMSEPTSGTQRVVLTDVLSGTMITGATDSTLRFDLASDTLFASTFSGTFSGNSTSATTASNVVGLANAVLFNNGTDTTTTTSLFTYDGTQLRVQGNVRANDIRLGFTNGTTIDTTSGDLILDSSNDRVHVTANCEIDGSLTVDAVDPVTIANVNKDTAAVVISNGSLGVEGKIVCGNDIIAFNSSDLNLKQNLKVIPNAVEKIGLITGYTYDWKDSVFDNSTRIGISTEVDTDDDIYMNEACEDGHNDDTGVIAQDVEKLNLPGITVTRDDGIKAVRYERLIPVLIEAVKELSDRISALESS